MSDNIIDLNKQRELKVIAEALADKIEYNNVYVIANEDEFSVGIEGTTIKVSFWTDNVISFSFDESHAIVLPRDIFSTLVNACGRISDSECKWAWPEELDIPLAEYEEEDEN